MPVWRAIAIVVALPLTGCGTLTDALAPPYVPEPIHIYDQAQYQADVAECQAAGATYKPKFSVGAAISRTVTGATSNSSMIPLSPMVPLYGAAGGAVGAASDGFDVMSGQHAAVFRNCLHAELMHDHAAVVADPRP